MVIHSLAWRGFDLEAIALFLGKWSDQLSFSCPDSCISDRIVNNLQKSSEQMVDMW